MLQCTCGHFKTPTHVIFCKYATGMPFQATKSRTDTTLGLVWQEFILRIRLSQFCTRVCPWNNEKDSAEAGTSHSLKIPRPWAPRGQREEGYLQGNRALPRGRGRRRPRGLGPGPDPDSSPRSSGSEPDPLSYTSNVTLGTPIHPDTDIDSD